jgi:hypothetical protein
MEYENHVEECRRKFAEMQAEIRELRARVDAAQNK